MKLCRDPEYVARVRGVEGVGFGALVAVGLS
jgi:hypothetical protein